MPTTGCSFIDLLRPHMLRSRPLTRALAITIRGPVRFIRRSSTVLRLFLLLCFAWPWCSTVAGAHLVHAEMVRLSQPADPEAASPLTEAPQKARDLLKKLQERAGAPLPGYIGGREFQNRERRLPRGRYREYDVNPKQRGRPRDAERIVIEQLTQKAYYTPDHYRTFIPLN